MTFLQLALICLVAILGPALSLPKMVHLPVVVGELLVGLALGRTGAQVLHPTDPTFSFLADVGFALVMLVVGSNVPLRDPAMKKGAVKGLMRAALVGVIAAPLGVLVAHLFNTGHGALYAAIMASSSASLVMPALAGEPLTGKSFVDFLPQLAIADAACIVVLPLVIDPGHVVQAAIGAVLVAIAGAIIFVLLRWVEQRGYRKRIHEVSEQRGLALELRISLTLLFALAALAQSNHVSIMLAGFVIGLAFAGVGEPRRLAKQLFGITEGFFAPIFFVWLGASLDLRALADHPDALLLGLTLGAASVLAHGLLRLTGQPLPLSLASSAQLGVPVAAATTGTHLGIFKPGENTALLLSALVTIAVVAAMSSSMAKLARKEAGADDDNPTPSHARPSQHKPKGATGV